jgi:DNA-binding transcriptional LysR family regulator
MKMTLKQLQVFVAVVKYNSVSGAAREIFLSQSAVSTALSELETRLKTPLFSRHGKKLILNQSGLLLLPKAHEILNKIQEINKLFSEELVSTQLTIGASATISQYLLADIIKSHLLHDPNTKIALKINNAAQLVTSLNQFKIDVGFSETFFHHPEIEVTPWYEDSFVIVAGRNHTLAKKKTISKEELMEATWILPEQGSGVSDIFESHIAPHLNKINIRMSSVHNDVIRQLVASGFGISFMSTMVLGRLTEQTELVTLNTPFSGLKRIFYRAIRKNDNNSVLNHFLSVANTLSPVNSASSEFPKKSILE